MQQFISNFNQLSMFRAIISPILRGTYLLVTRMTWSPAGNFFGALYHKL